MGEAGAVADEHARHKPPRWVSQPSAAARSLSGAGVLRAATFRSTNLGDWACMGGCGMVLQERQDSGAEHQRHLLICPPCRGN